MGEFDFGSFRRLPQPRLQKPAPAAVRKAQFGFYVGVEALEEDLIEIVAPQVVVPGGSQDLNHPCFHAHHRDVEGAPA